MKLSFPATITASAANLAKSLPQVKETIARKVPPQIKGPLQKARADCSYYFWRYGPSVETWLEITQIAIRVLAPFGTLFLSLVIFPTAAVHVIAAPLVLTTIFLTAFYGIKEEESQQNVSLVKMDDVSSIRWNEELPLQEKPLHFSLFL